MGKALVVLRSCVRQEPRRQRACLRIGYDLIVTSVHDEQGDICLLQIVGEVDLREGPDAS